MSQEKAPVTAAIRALRQHKVAYTEHLYDYVEKGGTAESSRQLGVPEHAVIKTLVMEDEARKPLIVLMHGDCETSTRNLARQTGRKHIEPCSAEVANRHTGYLVGGTSPLGTRKAMPVYVEKTIMALDRIYLNGGKRGFLVGLDPKSLLPLLQAELVEVANPHE
ncbi:Cys-tRNA(Pro) deacylase [Chitinimonas viridis]|uniref:Cys-tRNA(Pro)/Cys-tRNA(Cys) deacylase n=2 Tax=Chitinimonas TaxID=240411 RepID=A0ABT8B7H4_9NEIS|nr:MULTISPECIES: Cys-tRNA(Pro) deacylase [Chitinimonas]MDN3577722.1 Cys-tRNA(Pro) deacylase [Chitinimonas viridis]GLR15269.1 Cys-tRNA(Pro)/Cys-tRNA(Cys) deacylase [Chitinimonas prasina]